MISANYNNYSTEPVQLIMPTYLTAEEPEPFEAELRSRLHDIIEEWEDRADNMTHPALQTTLRDMIDQIDDAMYPPEED